MTPQDQHGVPKTNTWKGASSAFTIEYALDVMEELRAYAQDGFQRIPYGGIEEGGVLYGRLEGETVKVLEWRPIASDHAAGPSFTLSPEDIAGLNAQLAQPDSGVASLTPVGWFASHSRSKLELKPSDIELHEGLFPESWQVVLLIKATKDAPAQGAFFLRDRDGALSPLSPAEPFEIRANPALLAMKRTSAPRSTQDTESQPVRTAHRAPARATGSVPLAPPRPIAAPSFSPPAEIPAPAAASTEEAPALVREPHEIPEPAIFSPPAPRTRRTVNRFFLVATLCAVGGGAVVAVPRLIPAEKAALALQANEVKGATAHQLHLKWELNAPAFQLAERATIEIVDGNSTKIIELDSDEIQRGSLTYIRQSGDIQIRMTVHRRNQNPVQELARYIGPPVDSPAEAAAPLDKPASAQIVSETEKLRQALRQEQAKTKRLEDSVAIIQTRLDQENSRNP